LRLALASLLAALLAAPGAPAQERGLTPVVQALAAVRGTHGINTQRDAGPELTPVKRALRGWVEARLASAPPGPGAADRLAGLQKQLNGEIAAAGLTCEGGSPAEHRCEDRTLGFDNQNAERGYLGEVAVSLIEGGRYLQVQTNVGVTCGYDESLYLYEPRGGAWRLALLSEQDRYDEKDYRPQNLISVSVSPPARDGKAPLALTLGYSPWCSSNWQELYSRLWRLSPTDPAPRPLADDRDSLFIGDSDFARGDVTGRDALVEFLGDSVDGGVLVRLHFRRYRIGPRDKLRRIGPVALDPADFVEEWLTAPWREARSWSAAGADPGALARWRRRLHRTHLYGDFDDPRLRRCRADRSLWQVGLELPEGEGRTYHFLVRWRAPYALSMMAIRRRAFHGCEAKVKAPVGDGEMPELAALRRGAPD
jgi:hypothetical protein